MIDLMPNMTLLYQWGVFVVVLVVLNFGIFRPALRIIAARRESTEGDEAKAEILGKKMGELALRIEESLNEARTEGQKVIAELKQEAETTAHETIQKTRDDVDAELKTVRAELEKKSKEVEMQLRQHAQDLSKTLAQRVIGRNVG